VVRPATRPAGERRHALRYSPQPGYDFNPPLVVDASGAATNLTIRLDITTWFLNTGTGALIEPGTANPGGANESVGNQNIKRSVQAFEDRNRDGDAPNG
jgi:hypothetical protein